MKKLMSYGFAALAVLGMPLLQACDGHYHYHPPHHHPAPHHPPHHGHPGHGHPGHGHPGHGHPGHGHGGWGRATEEAYSLDEAADRLAADYDLRSESAQKIVRMANGDTEAASEMGVGVTEAAALTNKEMPSKQSIDKISAMLGEDPSKIENVVSDFISDIQSEEKAAQ